MGFTRSQLEECRGVTVPDLIGPGVRLLFVGINPGLWTAATQTHFCHPTNRFYPALRAAGLIDFEVDTTIGMTELQRLQFTARGLGITNLVRRATARASELTSAELRSGAGRVAIVVGELEPEVVAIAGVSAYRTAFDDPAAKPGLQPRAVFEAETWVIPNPSGLNAHETIHTLTRWMQALAGAAGLA